MKSALALTAFLALTVGAQSQTYKDSGGTVVPAVVPLGGCPVGGGPCSGPASSSNPINVVAGGYDAGPLSNSQTPGNTSHTGGMSVGGLFTIAIARLNP